MSYVAVFSPEAIDDIDAAALTASLLEQFEKHVARLEADPVTLSRPSWFPYPQCQLYEFSLLVELARLRFRILFKYGADEHSLYVLRVDIAASPL